MSRRGSEGVHLLLTDCPECGAPAEISQVRRLDSTAGPLAHGRVLCVRRHCFLMPVGDLLPTPAAAGAPAPRGRR